MKLFARTALVVAILVLGLGTSSALAQDAVATVTVIHAVPAEDGFPADVYLNGDLIIDGFLFETASELFTVPAGTALQLEVFPEGSDPDADDPAVASEVTFEAGVDYSIVAQVVGEAPVLTVFVNDTSAVPAGQTRLTVRQTSLVTDLDVVLDGADLFGGLAQATDATADVSAGSHDLAFLSLGETLDERALDLDEGGLVVLYVVGSPDDDSFSLLVQRIIAQQTSPSGVPSGTGGLKAQSNWMPYMAGAAVLGLLALVLVRRGPEER
ncbi:MAG: DUF4397 domain-containing protein [Acidimicrobiia bacterium]|nr:DUF4397 domain-containing protein [Acidimicrobiia bacterium]MDQ3501760.1 DUF4397 domain-containing protein [Actinomycetota bacterium]